MTPVNIPNMKQQSTLETPTSGMARLEVKSRTKRAKLASSKSLTQLVPRSLFFLKRNSDSNGVKESHQEQHQKDQKKAIPSKLVTCRSFPAQNVNNVGYNPATDNLKIDDSLITANDMSIDLDFDLTPEICDRMDTLKSWPRKPSIHNTLKSRIFGDSNGKADDRQKPAAGAKNSTNKTQSDKQENQADGENGLPGLGIIFNPQKGRFLFMRGNRFVNQVSA